MDNKQYQEIVCNLERELEQLHHCSGNMFQNIEKAIGLCNSVIIEIRNKVLKEGFKDQKDEIHFFKYIKPCVGSNLIFFIKLFDIEIRRRDAGKEIQIEYLECVLSKLHYYFRDNKEFCEYYWRKQTHLDDIYFLRGKSDFRIHKDNFGNLIDPDFSTNYDQTVAKIIAHERLVKYVDKEIIKLKNEKEHVQGESLDNVHSNAHWSDTDTALVELIYALDSAKVVNHGHIEIKELVEIFEKMFNVKLVDYYRIFKEIQKRKKDRTKFLNSLVEALNKRMYDLDE